MMTEFIGLRGKIYRYLMDDDSENKKAAGTERCVIKGKLKFQCLVATQLKNKTNHLEKYKIDVDSFKEYHKEFTKKTIN